ncbi:hypothetical protein 12Stean4476_00029 [Erwinia phage Stean]|nr:hypothetical protein 12Stean4476_00029 [Erwinia phage Stean]
MQFKLNQFNEVRYARGADAASFEVTENDGTSVHLWMNLDHIRKNVVDFGPHPDLLKAGMIYGRGQTVLKLVEAYRKGGRDSWLKPVEASRCSLGYYTHVDFPSNLTDEQFESWASTVGLDVAVEWMSNDPNYEELNERYGAGDNDILAWEPEKPEGDGWFIGSIHETDEDCPVCVWLRHKGPAD